MASTLNTTAERHLNTGIEALRAAAGRTCRVCCHIIQYTFNDGSVIEVRKLSGRSAFSSSGQHLGNSK